MKLVLHLIFLLPVMAIAQSFKLTDSVFSVGLTCQVQILFDFDKAIIRPESYSVLDSIVTFLENNPSLQIEIENHKDSRGKMYSSNLTMSRAKSVTEYLIGKKIDPRRVVARGYGDTKPIISNAQIEKLKSKEEIEKAHQTNRRTELKILSISYPNICMQVPDTLQGMLILQTTKKLPVFPGGDGAMFKHILSHLHYPTDQKGNIQTRIYISYVVDTAGKVKNACIFRPFYITELSPLDKMALKVFEEMPLWKPAELANGRKTPFRMSFPLRIEVK